MFGNDRNDQAVPVTDDQSGVPMNDQQFMNNYGQMGQMNPPMQSDMPADYIPTDQPPVDQPQQSDNNGVPVPVSINTPPPAPVEPADLAAIKQQALQELSPIIDHLEQSPEERFQITMMMLQATDDPNLVQQAYQAAKAIGDEKKRAKALLDVVNEITYFSQQSEANK